MTDQSLSLKKEWGKLGLGIVGGVLLGLLIVSHTQLKECLSESLQDVHYALFLKSPLFTKPTFHYGDIVLIYGHREDHVGDLPKWPYTKRVLGLPGDKILRDKKGIRIQSLSCEDQIGEAWESQPLQLLKKTSTGKPLRPISATIIPKGHVFVSGDNPNSFDSRYEEFGLVPQEKIWGKAALTW